MRILWAKSDFLHPTTKGGHIRTLEMLRRMRQEHEIHYVAFAGPEIHESLRRSSEYATKVYPIPHSIPGLASPALAAQLVQGLFSPLPVTIMRYRSRRMREQITELIQKMRFDALVCDFIMPAINFPDIRDCVIFEHNVETMIWRRHAETAPDPVRRAYFQNQADKMFQFERAMCRAARHVIGVSAADAALMRSMFGIEEISHVATGVDVEYFAPKPVEPQADLVFVGSMDWLPNIDGVMYFTETVLPVIRRWRPDCSFAVVGRNPPAKIKALAKRDPNIRVTGTVPDVRPYLWGSKVSVVPLRIGGGTRLKIYESMAARVPVVSTTIGAEGLDVHPPHDISIADTPESFASACVALLNSEERRQNMASEAWNMVTSQFSWAKIALHFEEIIQCRGRLPAA